MKELCIKFNKKHSKVIKELAEELEITNIRVIASAMALFEAVVKEHKKGNNVGIIKDDEIVQEIVGIFAD